MKPLIIFFALIAGTGARAQICLNNFDFGSVIFFDPAWVYGCSTGTSCSGGTQFCNLASCEPVTAIDPCAVAPVGCGPGSTGSDLWYKFYPSTSNVTISAVQNSSFVVAIQAFSTGVDCAFLTEVGCAVASGPSGGVTLNLTGLTLNQVYYFRIFGMANGPSQRTGNFCFCGTTGLGNSPLPLTIEDFHVLSGKESIALRWNYLEPEGLDHFVAERSEDGNQFSPLGEIYPTSSGTSFSFTDANPLDGANYYRIRMIGTDGNQLLSAVIASSYSGVSVPEIAGNPCDGTLKIISHHERNVEVFNHRGESVLIYSLSEGENEINVQFLPDGMYYLKYNGISTVSRFLIQR